jgi:hypothetical protein
MTIDGKVGLGGVEGGRPRRRLFGQMRRSLILAYAKNVASHVRPTLIEILQKITTNVRKFKGILGDLRRF